MQAKWLAAAPRAAVHAVTGRHWPLAGTAQAHAMRLQRCGDGSGGGAARAMASSALRSARIALRKQFGQHLLVNPDVVARIVDAAELAPTDTAFEIGPGTGNLTMHLLQRAARVCAVELDPRMVAAVTVRVAGAGSSDRFQCVHADVLRVNWPRFDALVANIPYQISSPILGRLFTHVPRPRVAVLMFQKEFAERMVARPGTWQYSRLSVNTQLCCESVRMAFTIRADQFRPPPKVDSAVVVLRPTDPPAWLWQRKPDMDDTAAEAAFVRAWRGWDAFLRTVFASKNKTLRAIFGNKHTLARAVKVVPVDESAGTQATLVAGDGTPLSGFGEAEHGGGAGWVGEVDDEAGDEVVEGLVADEVVRTAAGEVKRVDLLSLRDRIRSVLDQHDAGGMRANGLPGTALRDIYCSLRDAGVRLG